MDKSLIYDFWGCGDDQIIDFAIERARLNKHERDVVCAIFDDCMTQEETAEKLNYSTRRVNEWWRSAVRKLLNIPWVLAYAKAISEER